MKLLIDTQVLLWWLANDARVGAQARGLLADPQHDVFCSVVSLWEIVVKMRVGKLRGDIGEIAQGVRKSGFLRLDIGLPHLTTLAALPIYHRDPFDHLLMAQAITEKAVFLLEDREISRYPVQAMICSDQSPELGEP